MPICTVEEVLNDIRLGKMVILCDDEDRENEGDLTMAAEKVTPEAVNFMAKHKETSLKARMTFQLASGNVGVLAALNETIMQSQILNFILVMGVIFLLCSITYQSTVAAIILMFPLTLANFFTVTIMRILGIGLNVNTLPIVSVGVGVGIDYGIYLLSRICEEYRNLGEYSFITATKAIKTTGKAIFFTATTMIVGVIFWYFLSELRFQAEMGPLLAIIMFINMVGALLVIPSVIYIFKPRFLGRITNQMKGVGTNRWKEYGF